MANDVLGLNAADINHFHKDILQFARLAKEIDRYYGKGHTDLDKYLPKYKKWAELFNKKYNGITLKVEEKIDRVNSKLLLNDESIQKVFENVASKIVGLKSVGVRNFGIVEVSDSEGFMQEVQKAKKQLHITYFDPETGSKTVFLTFDETEKKAELHYDTKEIILQNSPEFRIASFYALKDGFDKTIKFFPEGATFGFDDLLSEREKAEWFEQMTTRILE